jgi:hypothetical protein
MTTFGTTLSYTLIIFLLYHILSHFNVFVTNEEGTKKLSQNSCQNIITQNLMHEWKHDVEKIGNVKHSGLESIVEQVV